MKKAIFIDKDGTLIPNIPYNVDVSQMTLTSGAGDALRSLHRAGFRIIVISNQPGIALGKFTPAAVGPMEEKLNELLLPFGLRLDDFYYCPHHPKGVIPAYTSCVCLCRKPQPGMILQAAKEHGIALSHSWMIGDILNDVEAGNRAGCKTVLIDNGNEIEWELSPARVPHFLAQNLTEAASFIHYYEEKKKRFTTQQV